MSDLDHMDDMDDLDGAEYEEPIAELATLLEDVPETLGQRIRARIQRRVLAADVAEFSFGHVFSVFVEFLKVIFESLPGASPERGEEE